MQHGGEALESFVTELLTRLDGDVSRVVVGIEMTADAVVEILLERGIAVYGLNPKQIDRFRDRHSLAGAKDDRRDAFVLADALRTEIRLFIGWSWGTRRSSSCASFRAREARSWIRYKRSTIAYGKVQALLKKRRIRRFDADTILTTLAKTALPVAPGVAEAASEHARMIIAVLRAAIAQREHADRRMEEVLAELEPAPAPL